MATPQKKVTTRGDSATSQNGGTPPLADMPTPAPKPAKRGERLFVAWTGVVVPDPSPADPINVRDFRVFGVKAECTEFAVDQEPAWKWVETAKGESVKDAIIAKLAAR